MARMITSNRNARVTRSPYGVPPRGLPERGGLDRENSVNVVQMRVDVVGDKELRTYNGI